MKTTIENAIKALAAQSGNAALPQEAIQFAQAALNLAHTVATLKGVRDRNESQSCWSTGVRDE